MPIRNVFAYAKELETEIENLGVDDLKRELASGDDLLLVDIREIQERVDKGTIAGSKHAARGMLEFWADPASPYYRDWFTEHRRTILFCAGGGRSVYATKALQDMGFTNVANFPPGFGGWVAADEGVEDVSATSRWIRRESA